VGEDHRDTFMENGKVNLPLPLVGVVGKGRALQAKGVTMPGSVDLLPGDYVLTFAAPDNLAGTIGTLSAPLKVP
jgi:hypothetical protein